MVDYNQRDIGIGGAIWVSGITLLIASFISLRHIWVNNKNPHYREAQKWLNVILLGPMLVGWPCWAIVIVGSAIGLLEVAADVMKALIVYVFVEYTIRMLGWQSDSTGSHYDPMKVDVAVSSVEKVKHKCPCFGSISLETPKHVHSFLWRVKWAMIQYGLTFLLSAVASCILLYGFSTDYLHYGSSDFQYGYVYINYAKIVTSIYAMYFMMMFMKVTKEVKELKNLNMTPKFKVIEYAFMVTQIQPSIIGLAASYGLIADTTDDDSVKYVTIYTSNLLLCVEMIILAFVNWVVFPISDYKGHGASQPLISQIKNI
ncbi:unnamed protein product [Blepharisma stoltei]|uniref:Gustatory receptor n=1 Tax=Blepharisma stoltei TaxID=1481888 RepID=A0AAU9JJK7_9CILI|nr:unnamed protein product [Blepharisma stoltei]